MDVIKIKSALGRSWPAHGFDIKPGDNDIQIRTQAERDLFLGLVNPFVEVAQMVVVDGTKEIADESEELKKARNARASAIDSAVKADAGLRARSDARARKLARDEEAETARLDAEAAASDAKATDAKSSDSSDAKASGAKGDKGQGQAAKGQ